MRVESYTNDSFIMASVGDVFPLTAIGRVILGPALGAVGPNGTTVGLVSYRRDQRFPLGSLIARFGRGGDWFLVGEGRTVRAGTAGTLELRVNDADPYNNSGGFDVQVSVTRAAVPASPAAGGKGEAKRVP